MWKITINHLEIDHVLLCDKVRESKPVTSSGEVRAVASNKAACSSTARTCTAALTVSSNTAAKSVGCLTPTCSQICEDYINIRRPGRRTGERARE